MHVAAFPSAERALLAPAVAALLARHPALRVRTTELEPEAALPALRLGDVDLAVLHEDVERPAPPDDRLERVDLMEDPLRLVLPAGHPADAEAVALAALAEARWVATPPGHGVPRDRRPRVRGGRATCRRSRTTPTSSACSRRSSRRAWAWR